MLIARSPESLALISNALREAKVLAMACDTIYGLVGRAPDTVADIRKIKGRGEAHPFLQLISDTDMLEQWVDTAGYSDILSLWPGAVTFVFPLRIGGTAAFRVPEDNRLRMLLRNLGFPLYSTSVNRSGNPPLDEDSGILENRMSSTVVDVTSRPYRILRQGAAMISDNLLKG